MTSEEVKSEISWIKFTLVALGIAVIVNTFNGCVHTNRIADLQTRVIALEVEAVLED